MKTADKAASGAFAIRHQQHHSANQRNRAQDGRQGHTVMLFLGGLNGTNVQNLLVRGVGKALVHQRQDPEYDQNDGNTFHNASWANPAPCMRLNRATAAATPLTSCEADAPQASVGTESERGRTGSWRSRQPRGLFR